MAESKQEVTKQVIKDITPSDKVYNVNGVSNNAAQRRSSFTGPADIYHGPSTEGQDASIRTGDILGIPNWTMEDFINERTRYRMIGTFGDIGSSYWEPGTYFYKLFFNFNTSYGLLGGIINTLQQDVTNNNQPNGAKEINTASMYFENNCTSERFTLHYRKVLRQKQISLFKFAQLLNYLTLECPWVFKEVGGLERIGEINLKDIAAEEKSIQITFNEDAVDMRISTLIDLYKHACFDTVNQREIIPENLRKFDMSIILFNPPIKGLNMDRQIKYVQKEKKNGKTKEIQDGYIESFGSTNIKKKPEIGKDDRKVKIPMTYKCVILKNCEIKYDDLKSIPDAMDNGEGFKNSIVLSISYERSLVYSFNDILNAETLDNYYNEEQIKEFTGSGDSEGSQSEGISTLPVEEEKYKSIGPITLAEDKTVNVTAKIDKNSHSATCTIDKKIKLEEVSAVKEFSVEVYVEKKKEDGTEIDFNNEADRNKAIENTLQSAYDTMFNSMLESYGWTQFNNSENSSICLGEVIYYVKQQKTPVQDKNNSNPNNSNLEVSAISVKCVGKTYNFAGCANKLETCEHFKFTKINNKVVPDKSQESQETQETQETQGTKETYESVLANAPLDLINTVFAKAEEELRNLAKQIVEKPVYKYPNGEPELVS